MTPDPPPTLLCPDCLTPMTLLAQLVDQVVYLCPSCYPDDPRHQAAATTERTP